MKVKGLDGRTYTWSFYGRSHTGGEDAPLRSGLHGRVRNVLRKIYPVDRIMEEVGLPGSDGLRVDFFLPLRKLVVEAHGEQHYRFVAHFHGTPMGFLQSKQRDRKKLEWCELNGLQVIELAYNETEEEWEARLRQ